MPSLTRGLAGAPRRSWGPAKRSNDESKLSDDTQDSSSDDGSEVTEVISQSPHKRICNGKMHASEVRSNETSGTSSPVPVGAPSTEPPASEARKSFDAAFVNALHAAAEAAADVKPPTLNYHPDDVHITDLLHDLEHTDIPSPARVLARTALAHAAAPPSMLRESHTAPPQPEPAMSSVETNQRSASNGSRMPEDASPFLGGESGEAAPGGRTYSFSLDLSHNDLSSAWQAEHEENLGAFGGQMLHDDLDGLALDTRPFNFALPASTAPLPVVSACVATPPWHLGRETRPLAEIEAEDQSAEEAGLLPPSPAPAAVVPPTKPSGGRKSKSGGSSRGSAAGLSRNASTHSNLGGMTPSASSSALIDADGTPLIGAGADGAAAPAGTSRDAMAPRKEWAAWEDEAIRNGVLQMGARWRVIAAELPGRSDDAVRNRWSRLQQQMSGGAKPASMPRVRKESGEQRQSWTDEEDTIISSSVLEFGHRWNRIAERLPRRTEHAIRNRWHRLQMRAVDGDLSMPSRTDSVASLVTLVDAPIATARVASGVEGTVGAMEAMEGEAALSPGFPAGFDFDSMISM